jgi:hypothetical protein
MHVRLLKFPIGKRWLFLLIVAALTWLSRQQALAASTNLTWQAVGISEFMATNQETVLDMDGDASGWIEILNPTTNDVSLAGWSLTTNASNLRQWVFPNVVLPDAEDADGSDNFMVVFASGKNRAVNTNELHTNFRLPVNGGFLALVDNKTNIVSVFSNYPPQSVDVAYGEDVINPNVSGYFPDATPGDVNATDGTNFSPAVIFSRTGGTFLASFSLQLSTVSSNATVHYTLDGSPPVSDSAVYASPLSITSSVQVRARAFAAGLMPGPLHSETFLQLDGA